jgi:hypothetical protein
VSFFHCSLLAPLVFVSRSCLLYTVPCSRILLPCSVLYYYRTVLSIIVLSCFTIVVLWFSTTSSSTLVFLYYCFKIPYSCSGTLLYLHHFFTCVPVLLLPTTLLLLACNSSTCALVLSSSYTTTCTCTHYTTNLYSLFLSYCSTPFIFRCLGLVFLFLQYYLCFLLYCLRFFCFDKVAFSPCVILYM